MAITLRDTIKSIIEGHLLSKKGKVYGQCLTAVGWVGGTLPELYEDDGMVEISMADVAGGAFVVGASLAGDKPIYVVRYQGFQWYNCVSVVNYAAKSKSIWKRPCPIFVRSIAMEGGIGPVAGSSHHSLVYRMPGIKIAAPMTPEEYKFCYSEFIKDDEPYYISEHRKSYDNCDEFEDYFFHDNPDFTVFAISITRFEMKKLLEIAALNNLKINVANIVWIKPFIPSNQSLKSLRNSKFGGLILDDDYASGCQAHIANLLSVNSNKIVHTLGLEEKTAGFDQKVDILPPSAEKIFDFLNIIKNSIINPKV
jgi:pyruvate/2-oxoglutarate/acetoin dehydrogenase E1 component